MIHLLQAPAICSRSDIPKPVTPHPNAVLEHTKKIIDLNRRFPFYDLLVTLDHELTDKYLDVYYGKVFTPEKVIESHENLMGTIEHFLGNANAINPYAAFDLFLSDRKSKLLIKVDNQRVNGKVNKLISLELKTDDQEIKKRFEALKRESDIWNNVSDPNTSTLMKILLTNHLEHIPGVELVMVKDSEGSAIRLQPVSSIKKFLKGIGL